MGPFDIAKGLGSFGLNLYLDKRAATATYLRLLPALRLLAGTRGRNAAETRGLFEILAGLPQFGAKRENFRKAYIDKPDGWKELPDDPNKIPYGFWH